MVSPSYRTLERIMEILHQGNRSSQPIIKKPKITCLLRLKRDYNNLKLIKINKKNLKTVNL